MTPTLRALGASLALSLSATLATAAPLSAYSGYFAFGDSLSDNGNLSKWTLGLAPGKKYYKGRFSNGPVWTDLLAREIDHSRNYAFGGAEANVVAGLLPDFKAQILNHRVETVFGRARRGARPLASVLFGANDLFGADDARQLAAQTADAMRGLSRGISQLYEEGFRDVLVVNLPALDLTPRFISSDRRDELREASARFNIAWSSTMDGLEATYADLSLTRLDTAGLLADIAANPAAYGLSNATDACIDLPSCDGYVFFDSVHPTAAMHRLFAERAIAALEGPETLAISALRSTAAPVPLPASWLLLIAGIGALALRRRRAA